MSDSAVKTDVRAGNPFADVPHHMYNCGRIGEELTERLVVELYRRLPDEPFKVDVRGEVGKIFEAAHSAVLGDVVTWYHPWWFGHKCLDQLKRVGAVDRVPVAPKVFQKVGLPPNPSIRPSPSKCLRIADFMVKHGACERKPARVSELINRAAQ